MPPIARILLVVVVVASGVGVAMMFRKDDALGAGKETTPAKNLALQSDTPRVVTDPTRLEQPPLREGAEVYRSVPSGRRPSNSLTDRSAAGDRFYAGNRALGPMPPPRFAPTSPLRPGGEARRNPLRDPSARRGLPLRDGSQATMSGAAASGSAASGVPVSEMPVAAALRRHKVVDGDTLTRLAQRYLGDHRRFAEIYAINRDLMPSVHALPIGSILRIPPREAILDDPTGGDVTTDQNRSPLRAIAPGTVRPDR